MASRDEIAKALQAKLPTIAQKFEEASAHLVVAADITVNDVDIVSGQEPPDDYDDEFIVTVEAEVVISGTTLCRMLGKQQRVLQAALKALDGDKVIGIFAKSKVSDDVLKALTPKVKAAVVRMADEEFERGVRITAIDYDENTTYWSSKVDAASGKITLTVEVGVIGKWV
jgi:hypothetical protein